MLDEEFSLVNNDYGFVAEHADELRKLYGENYIAVRQCRVVDNDNNCHDLSKRVRNQFPGEVVFISTVDDVVNQREI